MPYQIFEKTLNRRTNPPTITIGPSGRISFNKAASERIKRDAFEYALLMWDADTRKIAIRPIKKKDPRAFSLGGKNGHKGTAIAAKSFIEFIGAEYTQSRHFAAHWSDAEAAYEISLDHPDGTIKDEEAKKAPMHKKTFRAA